MSASRQNLVGPLRIELSSSILQTDVRTIFTKDPYGTPPRVSRIDLFSYSNRTWRWRPYFRFSECETIIAIWSYRQDSNLHNFRSKRNRQPLAPRYDNPKQSNCIPWSRFRRANGRLGNWWSRQDSNLQCSFELYSLKVAAIPFAYVTKDRLNYALSRGIDGLTGTEGGSRTHTGLRPPAPQAGVYSHFTTSAYQNLPQGVAILLKPRRGLMASPVSTVRLLWVR